MEAEIRSIKKVGNDLEINLRAIIVATKPAGASFPNRIYISKYTHRPQLAQQVHYNGDKLIIESRKGAAFHKQYVRVSGHHLTYQEDFTPALAVAEVQLTNDDGSRIELAHVVPKQS